jgi:AAA domain
MQFETVSSDELLKSAPMPGDWLWDGYLAAGSITLLTSRWKSGKTTLISLLLARMGSGGELAGAAVRPGRAIIVSEESQAMWMRRYQRLNIGPQALLLSRPFDHRPTHDDWLALIDKLAAQPVQVTIIDPLAGLMPTSSENNAASMLDSLSPLAKLTAAGQAVLLLHHPRKDDESPRGSGALQSFVDILLRLDEPRFARMGNRQRWLRGSGRFVETPAERLIELTPDGLDYRLVDDVGAAEFAAGWELLQQALAEIDGPVTRQEILGSWPRELRRPSAHTIWNWLERAVSRGLVERCGTGRRGEPYRYRVRSEGYGKWIKQSARSTSE